MKSLKQKAIIQLKKLGKEAAALLLITTAVLTAVLLLGTTGCAISGTLTFACLVSSPLIYAVIIAVTFVTTIKIAHYTAEAAEYRRQNQQASFRKALRAAINDADTLKLTEVLKTSIEPVARKIEEINNDKEDSDEEKPLKVLD